MAWSAAHREDPVGPGEGRGGQDTAIGRPSARAEERDDYLGDSRRLGGHNPHQHGGDQGKRPAGT
jgi:hypothetical protein